MVPTHQRTPRAVTLKILAAAIFNLICYINVGMPLAVIAGFVHQKLGFNTIIAGLSVSIAYLATFLSRPSAGRWMDTKGPKGSVLIGLVVSAIGGIFLMTTNFFVTQPYFALGILFLSRFCSGASESWASAATNVWNIGRVGTEYTVNVISWNGVTSYGGMAIGAPLGLYLSKHSHLFGGNIGIGVLTTLLAGISALLASTYESVLPVHTDKRLSFAKVFRRIIPYGSGLGLGSVGFGSIQAFIALYFIANKWNGSAVALSLLGISFVAIRFIFANAITRWGGYRVSIASFLVESIGLYFLWQSHSVLMCYIGASLTGAGFSLIYPALGVIAVSKVGPENRGSALASFSLFLDIALCFSGPVLGIIQNYFGYNLLFASAGICTLVACVLTYILFCKSVKKT